MRSGKLEILAGSAEAGEAPGDPVAPGSTAPTAAPAPMAASVPGPGPVAAHAYAFATTFRLKELIGILPNVEVELDKDCLVLRVPGDAAIPHLAVLFDFGALVTIGIPSGERERLIRAINSHLAPEPTPPPPRTSSSRSPPAPAPRCRSTA
ncbi:MAG TPA: hypothetical protein PLW65_32800, partial [Pseudomonadota bacterium]|nr:hypothetical protein [Pseudomonadota bacterium]